MGNGLAAPSEAVAEPQLDVAGKPIDFDVDRVVPTDASNTSYAIALATSVTTTLDSARLRVRDQCWRPVRQEERLYTSDDPNAPGPIQLLVFVLPLDYAQEFASHCGEELPRLRTDAVRFSAATVLDETHRSADAVWVIVRVANYGTEPAHLLDPAGVWSAQDGAQLRVKVTRSGRDVTFPVRAPAIEHFTQPRWLLPGESTALQVCLSCIANVADTGKYRVSVAVQLEVRPLAHYFVNAPTQADGWTFKTSSEVSFGLIRRADDSVAITR